MIHSYRKLLAPALIGAMGLAAVAGSIAIAAPFKETKPAAEAKPAGQPEMKLPPGWTEADMQACVAAGTPGKMHDRLARDVGTWLGKCSTWMPGSTEPMKSDCTMTI